MFYKLVPQTSCILHLAGSDYSYAGGVRGAGTSSPKKTIKKERTDEETKEVLEHLLRDDVSMINTHTTSYR